MLKQLHSLEKNIMSIINEAVEQIFEKMFGVEIYAEHIQKPKSAHEAIHASVMMEQSEVEAKLVFSFDRELLYTLVSNIYPADVLDSPEALQDAACEITNIVCSSIKTYLNKNGFHLRMHLPHAEEGIFNTTDTGHTHHLHFSLKNKEFSVFFSCAEHHDLQSHA